MTVETLELTINSYTVFTRASRLDRKRLKPTFSEKDDEDGHMLGRQFDHSVKTVIVGESGVGKTSILSRFVRDVFEETGQPTLGVEFMSRVIQTNTRKIELQLWDTAGQEIFRSVTKGYYRGAIGAFIVYDMTRTNTFQNLEEWVNNVRSTAIPDVVCVLIGNKSDLADDREVPREAGLKFAEAHNLLFFETSAKTGANIEEAMLACLEGIEKLIDHGKFDGRIPGDAITVTEHKGPSKEKGCC
jgi:small GTP-binding protein